MDEHSPISDRRPGTEWSGLLDFGARWFRARADRRDASPLGEHGHWDPVRRDWRYHTHDSETERAS
jgi:hypothetical protein